MCRQRAGCNAGTLTARSLVEAAAGDVQAKGRLQPWSNWRVLGVLGVWSLANGRLECPNKRGLCAGKGQAWWKLPRGMCRQRAGCNPGAAKADGQRAWWKLPRGNWRVLGVWSLANGRLECPNKRGLCAGKGQAAMLERWRPGAWWKLPRGMCRQRAGCNPGAASADGQRAWWQLPRGNWRVLGVLGVWSLANGRLECPNKRGLCAGKGQAAMLERWRPGAWWKLPRGMCRQRAGCNPGAAKADGQRGWWKLPRGNWRVLGVLGVWSLANGRLECPNKRKLCAGKGQAAMLERWRPGAWWKLPRGMCRQRAGCNPGAAKADGQRAWWQLLGVWSLANGRLECPNKRGLCAGKGQAAMLERWRPGAWWKLPRGMCRQRAGCNPGAAKADGQGAWWKLPRGNWRVLGVLGVWSLANGRLECPNKRGLCAGKGQAAILERWRPGAWWKLPRGMCRQRAGCNPGAAKADGQRAWWKLLGVWSLANGRLFS